MNTNASKAIGGLRSLLIPGALILTGMAVVILSRPATATLEFEGTSDFSTIRIRKSGQVRSLLFVRDNGKEVVESRVDTAEPHRLMLGYSQSMFASHLIHESPQRVLIVGLGGGAMVHYLQHHFPDTDIDALEIDPLVVDVADRFFDVRTEGRLRITTVDAFEFLAQEHDPKYDVVYMDAFLKPSEETDATGVPQNLKTIAFFQQIQSNLNPDGVVVFNLNAHPNVEDDIATIEEAFHSASEFSSKESTNRIVIGTKGPIPSLTKIKQRAADLDARLVDSHSFVDLIEHCSDWTSTSSKGEANTPERTISWNSRASTEQSSSVLTTSSRSVPQPLHSPTLKPDA